MNSEPAIRVIAMPCDTNSEGDMFGGWIISQMDLAGYLTARKFTQTKLVTVAIDNIVFHSPVFVGDCMECHTTIEKTGRTSVTIRVESWVDRKTKKLGAPKEKVTEGKFVYVAIDKDRKPEPIHLQK